MGLLKCILELNWTELYYAFLSVPTTIGDLDRICAVPGTRLTIVMVVHYDKGSKLC